MQLVSVQVMALVYAYFWWGKNDVLQNLKIYRILKAELYRFRRESTSLVGSHPPGFLRICLTGKTYVSVRTIGIR